MPHPPSLVVGGDFEGGVDTSSMLFGRGICLIVGIFYCTCAHMCSPDMTKETAPVEGSYIIALFKYPIPPTFYHGLPT